MLCKTNATEVRALLINIRCLVWLLAEALSGWTQTQLCKSALCLGHFSFVLMFLLVNCLCLKETYSVFYSFASTVLFLCFFLILVSDLLIISIDINCFREKRDRVKKKKMRDPYFGITFFENNTYEIRRNSF